MTFSQLLLVLGGLLIVLFLFLWVKEEQQLRQNPKNVSGSRNSVLLVRLLFYVLILLLVIFIGAEWGLWVF